MVEFIQQIGDEKSIVSAHEKSAKVRQLLPLRDIIVTALLRAAQGQQGFLVEEILKEAVKDESHLVCHDYSDQTLVSLEYTQRSAEQIEEYFLEGRRHSLRTLRNNSSLVRDKFTELLDEITDNERWISIQDVDSNNFNIDLLFTDTRTNVTNCIEIKFSDYQRGRSFENIVRKMLLIYAGLLNDSSIPKGTVGENTVHIGLYYFNVFNSVSTRRYLPEDYVYKGKDFFQSFLTHITYREVVNMIEKMHNSSEVKDAFDDMYSRVGQYIDQHSLNRELFVA